MNKTCDTCYFFEPTPGNIPYVGACLNTGCQTARDLTPGIYGANILESETPLAKSCSGYKKPICEQCRIFQDGHDNPDAGWDEYSKWCGRMGEFVRGEDEACERFEATKKD